MSDPLQHVPLGASVARLVSPQSLSRDTNPLRERGVRNLCLGEVGRELHDQKHVTSLVTGQARVTRLVRRQVAGVATC